MPLIHLKTLILDAHLFGLAIGLGGATILDIKFLMLVGRGLEVSSEDVKQVKFISTVVSCALALLWISGIGFMIQYYLDGANRLDDPKLLAKIIIVTILTLNGMVLHSHVLPIIYSKIGCQLFDSNILMKRFSLLDCFSSLPEQLIMLSCGTISMVSWYVPAFLGIAKELSFVVPMWHILAVYAGLVLLAVTGTVLVAPPLLRHSRRRRTQIALARVHSGKK